ncbi:MAG: SGNH/GDSL hydrolase family protein [Candidatus Thalassarchaeum sp.]|nr:SGNH/GDSL hydrolase family protein [Candidatus Thalassarchaeum sp.]
MGRRLTLLLVASLLAFSWSVTIPVEAADARGSEGGSILFEQKIFASSEPVEATIGLWGLTVGRNYELHWTVHATNVSSEIGPATIVSSGIMPFFSNQNAMQIQFSEHHVANDSMMYYLEIGLNSSSGWTDVSAFAPFSVFWKAMSPQYTDMLVFGDSLSDSGNTYSAFGTPESPPYWQGRYAEGKNWVDFTDDWLGISNIAARGGASGNNRAFGGAATGNGMTYWVIENIGKQVDDWDQNHNLASGDAVAIWGGGNDLINYGETNAQTLVNNLEEHAEQLISAGGQEFIFFELPPLEKTPSASGDSAQDRQALGQRVADFNSGMHTMAANLASTYGVVTHMIPIWVGFEMLYYSGEHFGITNVTHAACEHDGATCDSNAPIAPNVEEYIFFDNLHPTTTTHRAVSLFVQQSIGIPDYDGDEVADQMDACPHTMPGSLVGTDGCEVPPADSDEDGVIDDEDACPNTESGLSVDENGCASNQLDTDQDGVMDDVDECPDTQPGWNVNSVGCSEWEIDSDDDGVVDGNDDCPQTDEGEDVDGDGCADEQRDSDNDGVTDDLDACPNTPREEIVNELGCSGSQIDDDGDGIYNYEDACPNTPLNEDDVEASGCGPSQRDTDEDGVNDDVDQCPGTEWLTETDDYGCAANQRDTDGDGRKDSVDGCPEVWGSLNGCPVLTIELQLLEAPDSESRTANISVTIACESGCYMDWTLQGNSLVSEGANLLNGTYYTSYTNLVDESKALTGRVSVDGMWKDTMMTVYFPPIEDEPVEPVENQTGPVEGEQGPSQSNSAGEQGSGFELDTGSIAMIAMLLLLNVGVVAAIMASRSRSKKKRGGREQAMAAFERDLFSQTGPVAPLPSIPATPAPAPVAEQPQPAPVEYTPPQQTQEPVAPTAPVVPDLPSIEDLLG